MFRFILSIVSTFVLMQQVHAQEYIAADIPKELRSRASAILRDEKIELDMKNESNVTQQIFRAITILNKSGEDYADLMMFYDKSKVIKDIKGQILDEFGMPIGKFSQKDFKDYSASGEVNMYDDVRIKHFKPSVSTYPYTIVYSYQIKHNQTLFIPYWRPNANHDLAVEKSTYQFTCKKDLKIRTSFTNYDMAPEEVITDKVKTLTWSVSNLKARKLEALSPITHPEEIIIKIVPENFFYFKKQGHVTDWNNFGKWVFDNLLEDKQDLPLETINKVKSLTANAQTTAEKASILYKYVQEKTRYISIQVGRGGLEPFPASYVDKLGYGDCKALVNYMQALLAAADIPSLYCVVEAGDQKISLDESFANAVDGNHIILCIPNEKDSIWLECTSNRSPFNYLGDFTDDRLVLACTPEGGKVLRTPSYKYTNNIASRKGSFTIDNNGSIKGNLETNYSGSQFENHFGNKFNNSTDQIKQLKKYYPINNTSFSNISYHVLERDSVQLTEKFDLEISNHLAKTNNSFLFTPNLFNIQKNIAESKNRSTPLYINRGYTDIDSITFTFEDKIAGNIIPFTEKIECPMGFYELKISMAGQKVKYLRKIQIKEGSYTTEQYQEYYNFIEKVAANDRLRYNITVNDKK